MQTANVEFFVESMKRIVGYAKVHDCRIKASLGSNFRKLFPELFPELLFKQKITPGSQVNIPGLPQPQLKTIRLLLLFCFVSPVSWSKVQGDCHTVWISMNTNYMLRILTPGLLKFRVKFNRTTCVLARGIYRHNLPTTCTTCFI